MGILGFLAAVVIPMYLHRQKYPRRELRYAILRDDAPGIWRLRIWSTSRADIPSATFDDARPIIFTFSRAVADKGPGPSMGRRATEWIAPTELAIAPQLLRTDFSSTVIFSAHEPFSLQVENSLIDVPVSRDTKVETYGIPRVEVAIRNTRTKSRISALAIVLWLTAVSFALFVLGLSVATYDDKLGEALGIPGMLLLTLSLVALLVIGLRRLFTRGRKKLRF
ncbi:hypothetical protein [Curtobacterium flaccumfaciens]|uniref:hypothetical protein n=1 Tax=Curtobacterium flaccumfaciens TaxID=2035 RepID=UPI000FFF13AE|nr:hypothetical protein [Curtobacterium flaccumfaciens]MCS0646699.1 hypothetical protein [Curtobacterium flaccumfaciens pv. flaccumfaciens]MCS6525926.1 hypothetical protein [Curtobacterium flaccumfaciens pv. flaccumfaciens]MCS6528719.1 hypothetical protein [Curtobacterium flaccumfaciens pv. flaccumfaciens]NUU11374.1 hypothetical protein [Curtobacterium flaccumfaciens]